MKELRSRVSVLKLSRAANEKNLLNIFPDIISSAILYESLPSVDYNNYRALINRMIHPDASGIVATTAFMLCTFHPYMFYALNGSCKLRVACGGLIYKKALKILKASAEEGQNGKIINILSSDLARFELAFAFLHDIWDGPFEMVLFLGVIYWQISWAGVIGVVFMLAFIPLQGNKINRI